MHHIRLVLNIRLLALVAVTAAVLLAASVLAPPRQASAVEPADYTDPTGVLCFQLFELDGNPLPGIGLVRIDNLGGDPPGDPDDNITFSSFVYTGTGTPTCQPGELQDSIPPSASSFGGEEVLAGTWDIETHTIVADVCQTDLNFGPVNFAFAKVLVNFVLPPNPTEKLIGTFGLAGPYTDDTCTVEEIVGFSSFPVDIISGPYLAGVPLGTANTDSNWDKDGGSDWQELAPDKQDRCGGDPFKAGDCAGSVGGVAELAEAVGTPLAAPDSSGSNTGLIAGIMAAITAGAVTLGGAAWYASRRSIQ